MAENTKIEWADHTFNPWIGCSKVGPGCDHCYAENLAGRWNMAEWGPGAERKRTSEANWKLPLRWQKRAEAFQREHHRRQRVFCASLGDVFDNEVNDQWRIDLFSLIFDTPDLDWLLLTKRIGNVEGMLLRSGLAKLPDNVWLGATIVNQTEADRDIPKLLAVPAAKRFLSMEPLLGPVDLTALRLPKPQWEARDTDPVPHLNALARPNGIDWVLVGGETGAGARPIHPEWARSLRDQCNDANVPFLFKQWGDWLPRSQVAGTPMRVKTFSEGQTTQLDGETFLRSGKKWAGRKLDGETITETPA